MATATESLPKNFTINVSVDVKEGDQPWWDTTQTWHAADYRQVVLIQDALVGALDRLVETGYLHAASKGANPQEGAMAHEVVRGKK